ncbi:hypothetical protein [Hirschia litorea]|uniref:Holin of 3TMs, for gene-transfer release n=1 Tax=Hirschia litorea TaxID=1199156 RepID=A0ABW2IJD6_9PROT
MITKHGVKTSMDTDETFTQQAVRMVRDMIASLSIAFLPAAIVGLLACFFVELYLRQDWVGIWPPLSWSTSVLSFIVFFVFGFETPKGREFCNKIVWGNPLMRHMGIWFKSKF